MGSSSTPPTPFLLLSGNKAFLDGKRSRPCFGPGAARAAMVIAVVALALFAFPLIVLAREAYFHAQLRSLRKQGQRIEAVVVDLHEESRKDGRVCSVSYSFRLPGGPGTVPAPMTNGQDDVPAQCCRWFEDHSPEFCTPPGPHPCDRGAVMIYVDRSNPTLNRIDHNRPLMRLWVALAVTLFTGAFASWVAWTITRELGRKRRLGSRGTRILGSVRSAKVVRVKGGRIDLQYAFTNPEGLEIEAKAKDFWDNPAGTPPPMPGTPLVVIYVNDRLFEVL